MVFERGNVGRELDKSKLVTASRPLESRYNRIETGGLQINPMTQFNTVDKVIAVLGYSPDQQTVINFIIDNKARIPNADKAADILAFYHVDTDNKKVQKQLKNLFQ